MKKSAIFEVEMSYILYYLRSKLSKLKAPYLENPRPEQAEALPTESAASSF
jgi:hypothetical protein